MGRRRSVAELRNGLNPKHSAAIAAAPYNCAHASQQQRPAYFQPRYYPIDAN